MDKINTGFNTFSVVLGIVKYAPGIGTAVNAMKVTIDALRPNFNTAHSRVKQIDDKVWPWKSRVDNGITVCDKSRLLLYKSEPLSSPCLLLPEFSNLLQLLLFMIE